MACSDTERKKLVLHFDIRNTVLVADSVTNVSVEQALNGYLTSVAWGYVDIADKKWKWAQESPVPSIERPSPEAITYYKYEEEMLITNPLDRVRFRKMIGNFSQTEIGQPFLWVFEEYLKLLEYPFEFHPYLCMTGNNGKNYHYVLPAFFELLKYLCDQKIIFSIVLRTFGLDAPNVLNTTRLVAQGCHPLYPQGLPLSVCSETGKITRNDDCITLYTDEKVLSSEQEIYEQISMMPNDVSAVVDDFHWWMNHSFDHKAGKPFWIEQGGKTVHIFFDDNIRPQDPDSIVDCRILDGKKGISLEKEEIEELKDKHLVQVDLLSALIDKEYFIKCLNKCEKKLNMR